MDKHFDFERYRNEVAKEWLARHFDGLMTSVDYKEELDKYVKTAVDIANKLVCGLASDNFCECVDKRYAVKDNDRKCYVSGILGTREEAELLINELLAENHSIDTERYSIIVID